MAVIFKDYRVESRKDWGAHASETQGLTQEQIQTGAILRIADATELMAKKYQDLIDERDRYKRQYEAMRDQRDKLFRRISALQGVITKTKKKAK